jgi:hypothetical protein
MPQPGRALYGPLQRIRDHATGASALDEVHDISAAVDIREQVLGVVFRSKIPLLSFAMLMTKLAHKWGISWL